MNKRCAYCGVIFRPKRSTALYHSDACRVAASRQRQLESPINGGLGQAGEVQDGLVTLSPAATPPLAPVTLTASILSASEPAWRWYGRLDGSCDLYADTETTTRHVARLVRRDGRYRLTKPAHLATITWAEHAAAQDAVCNLVGKAA